MRVAVRLSGRVDDRALEDRLADYVNRKVPVWLSVSPPASVDFVERWRAALQGLLSRHRDGIEIVEIDGAPDARLAAFAIRVAATEARSARDAIRVAVAVPRVRSASWLADVYTPELSPYIDVLTLPEPTDEPAASAHLVKVDPDARLALLAGAAGDSADAAFNRIVNSQLDTVGTNVAVVAWRSSDVVRAALRRLAPVAPLLAGEITPLESSSAGLTLTLDGRDVTSSLRHRLLFDNRTFATYLVYWGDASPSPLDVSLTLPVEGEPALHRLSDGSKLRATGYSRNPETSRVGAQVPLPGGPMLIDFNEGAAAIFAARSDVSAERLLTVEEIIARHQQQQRVQDALVRNYTASARTQQHFRPTMTDPGYDVVSENRYFVGADGIEWEELSFSVNGSKWGPDRPPFPLLQAEKVLSLPLQLRFGNDYRYRLAGTERVGDYDCYVVRFEPAQTGESRYRGTIWIERKTFARVKVAALQTGLSAPVVSNEEIQTYAPVTSIGNRPIFLFTGLNARQIFLIAGRNILVEKLVAFDAFRVNDPAFDEARTAARRGERIMYRETDKGLRYYVKQGDARVVSDRETRTARAMAMGVTLDPWYAFPLPIFGINYLNFEFRGRPDTQLAILFAGVLAAGNIQRPGIGGSPFDASVDFFAIAVPSSDRLYDASGEREAERLLTWPLTTGLNFGWQVHAVSEGERPVSVQVRRLRQGHDDLGLVRRPCEHGHEWFRRGLGVPARRVQRRRERRLVRAGRMARLGLRAGPGVAIHLREIQREPLAGFLSRDLPEDSPERRVVRRTRSRSLREVPVRDVRRYADPRRPRVRSQVRRAWHGERIVLVQHLRPVPPGPVPRAGLGPRSGARSRVAPHYGNRNGREPPCALEYDPACGRRQELPAGAL